jgi:hypothetical protein
LKRKTLNFLLSLLSSGIKSKGSNLLEKWSRILAESSYVQKSLSCRIIFVLMGITDFSF